uniref:Uncharacterized protein n=1 Tax=Anopheles melas TaxID=34690 RepID=A0A182UBF7_9DIPT
MSYNADDCPDSDTVVGGGGGGGGEGGGGGGGSGGGATTESNCATPTSPGMTRQDAVVVHGDGGSIDGGDPATTAGPPSMAGYEPCDPLIILNLFQSLSATTNSLELQMKINLHVSYGSGELWLRDGAGGSVCFFTCLCSVFCCCSNISPRHA